MKNIRRKCGTFSVPTKKELDDAAWGAFVLELVAMGLLEDSGKRRNGQILWRRTSLTLAEARAQQDLKGLT